MDYTVFLNRINKKIIQGPYVFSGEEIYLADNTIEVLKSKYVNKNLEMMNYATIDASKASVNEIIESCYQLPFMSEKRLTVVKDISDNQIKEIGEKIEDLINIGSTSIVVFLLCPSLVKKTTNFYKKLSKVDAVVNFNSVNESQIKNWIMKKMTDKKISIDDDALELFLLHINYTKDNESNSLYFVDGELKKLYNLDEKNISIEEIRDITSKSPSSNIFELTEAISNRDEVSAIKNLNKLFTTSNEPVKILYMISRHIINMAKIYQTLNMSEYEATKRVGISSYEYKKIKSNLNKYDQLDIKAGLNLVKSVDLKLKSKKNDPRILLESLISSFIRFKDVNNVNDVNCPR